MPALHQNGVDFLSNAADASGQVMTTSADVSSIGAFTFTVTVEHDTFGTTGQQVIGQWGLGGDVFIFGTIRSGEFSAAADGYRWWMFNGSGIRVADYYVTLDGTRRTFVGRFDGSLTGDNRINLWHGTSADTALTDVTGSLSYIDPFGASGGFPATSAASGGPTVDIGGDTYSGSYGIDGRIINAAVWTSALSDAQIEGTSMWDSTFREPADHSALSPDSWWMMGDGAGDSGTTIMDQGADGFDGTLTNGGNPATNPSIVNVSFLEALVAPFLSSTTSFFAATVAVGSGGTNLSVPLNSTSTTMSAPTVSPGVVSLAPPFNASSTTLSPPTVSPGAVALLPGLNATTTTLSTPTVSPGAVDLTPPVNTTTTSLFAHTVATVGVQLLAPHNDSVTTFSAPTVSPGAVDLVPSLFASTTLMFAAVINSIYALTAPFLGSTTTFYAPSASVGAVNLSPPHNDSNTSFLSPTVAGGAVNLGAPLNATTTSMLAPAVAVSGINLQPGLQASTTSFFGPTITTGGVALLAPLLGTVTGFNSHSVFLGFLVAPAIGGVVVGINTMGGASSINTVSGAVNG